MNTTIKEDPSNRPKNIKKDFSKDELLKMLVHYEAELDRKEKEIGDLKDSKARSILNLAKYGQLKMGDPLSALNRDGALLKEDIDESVLNVYEYQQHELERLCQLHRSNHRQYKQTLQDLKRQHSITLEEVTKERRQRDEKIAQSNDLMNVLENAKASLEKKLEFKQDELEKTEKTLELERKKRLVEAERTRLMVLFLAKEHRKMVIEAHTKQQQLNEYTSAGRTVINADSPLVKELRKEIKALREERDRLASSVQKLSTQNVDLDKKLRIKEEDVAALRHTLKKKQEDHLNRIPGTVAGLVVANKGAQNRGGMTGPASTRSKLPNSSTFPSSVLAPSNSNQNHSGLPATNISYKKTPLMGTASANGSILPRPGNGRGLPTLGTRANLPTNRTRMMSIHASQTMPKRTPSSEPQQINRHDLQHTPRPQSIGSALAKRSSSLPRNNAGQPNSEPASPKHGLPSPMSGIPINYRQGNGQSRNIPASIPSGKVSRIMPHNRHTQLK